jgi:N-acyl-D-aspartate/D-glutamate deacylase
VLDLVITGATVYPGDAPPFVGTLGVSGSTITLVTNWHKDEAVPAAREVVDGNGLLLCPGLLDMPTHSALVALDDPYLTGRPSGA